MLKEIEKGVYKNRYLVYNRKSTDEPENQKNSIQYQKSENLRFALREKLPIASISIEGFCIDGIISEKHSAFKEDNELLIGENGMIQYKIDRPKFYKLIHFLSKGYFKGIIVLCWDRVSRNKGDEVIIRKLMKTGIEFRFVLATYDKSSSGALHMDIDGMFAEHHSRVTSEKVKINLQNQRAKGHCTYKAPVGYLNTGSVEEKPIDPVRAPLIKRMFELYATGEWSLASLAKWATENGFTHAPQRRKKTKAERQEEEEDDVLIDIQPVERVPTYTSIQRILTNKFYIGRIIGNDGEYVTSHSHTPIISVDLFYKVQEELKHKKICVKYLEKIPNPFRGIVRCGGCQRLYTPYIKKGNLYLGSRCPDHCTNPSKNFNIDFVLDPIKKMLCNISLSDEELEMVEKKGSTQIAVFEMERINALESLERKKNKLRGDLAYLRANKINLLKTGVYSPEELMKEEESLNNQILKLQTEESVSDEAMEETVKDVRKLSELLKTLKFQYDFANHYEKEEIMKLLVSELYVYDKSLTYKCNKGIEVLQNRVLTLCALNVWFSEVHKYQVHIRESIALLGEYCKTHPSPT